MVSDHHSLLPCTGGKVFLIDGSGSMQRATAGTAAYGASKAAMPQLMRSLAAEVCAAAAKARRACLSDLAMPFLIVRACTGMMCT